MASDSKKGTGGVPDGFDALQREVRSAAARSPEFLSFDATHDIDTALNKTACIEYKDADGNTSRRWITIRSVDECAPKPLIFAYCWVRRELRSFRADRVRTFIDGNGECISGRKFFKKIGVELPAPPPPIRSRTEGKPKKDKWDNKRTGSKKAASYSPSWDITGTDNSYTIGEASSSPLAGLKAAEERIRARKQANKQEQPGTGSVICGWVIFGLIIYLISLLF